MDRKDIERMTKLEIKIDHMQSNISQVLEIVNAMKCKQLEYVRSDDSSYFYRNMSKYNADSLQKKVNWLSYIDILYKLAVPVAVGFITFSLYNGVPPT